MFHAWVGKGGIIIDNKRRMGPEPDHFYKYSGIEIGRSQS